jgi:hypothetical protein
MHVEVFHDYCSDNKLKRIIPKGHRKYQQQEESEDDTSNNLIFPVRILLKEI